MKRRDRVTQCAAAAGAAACVWFAAVAQAAPAAATGAVASAGTVLHAATDGKGGSVAEGDLAAWDAARCKAELQSIDDRMRAMLKEHRALAKEVNEAGMAARSDPNLKALSDEIARLRKEVSDKEAELAKKVTELPAVKEKLEAQRKVEARMRGLNGEKDRIQARIRFLNADTAREAQAAHGSAGAKKEGK